jgi:hypothetical protein
VDAALTHPVFVGYVIEVRDEDLPRWSGRPAERVRLKRKHGLTGGVPPPVSSPSGVGAETPLLAAIGYRDERVSWSP